MSYDDYQKGMELAVGAIDRQRRLDHFAAAALTGLLAMSPSGVMENVTRLAWEAARAMLDNEPKDD